MTSSIGSSTGTNIVNLLGAGSGVDIKTLAQNLTDAEKAPQQALLDNAIKYVPPGGGVRLLLSDGPRVVIEDDGPGDTALHKPHSGAGHGIKPCADLRLVGRRIFLEEFGERHQHARRAEAALQARSEEHTSELQSH